MLCSGEFAEFKVEVKALIAKEVAKVESEYKKAVEEAARAWKDDRIRRVALAVSEAIAKDYCMGASLVFYREHGSLSIEEWMKVADRLSRADSLPLLSVLSYNVCKDAVVDSHDPALMWSVVMRLAKILVSDTSLDASVIMPGGKVALLHRNVKSAIWSTRRFVPVPTPPVFSVEWHGIFLALHESVFRYAPLPVFDLGEYRRLHDALGVMGYHDMYI